MTRAVAAAVFLACLAVNVRRLCPDIFPDDSPETVTACLTLGIGHPPGDPLMNLTGRLALALPVGGPAFRINVLAAALAAGLATGAWLLTARAMVLPLSRFAAAAAAIALVVSNPVLAQQAAVAKGAVYGWNLLLLLGTAAAVLSGRPL